MCDNCKASYSSQEEEAKDASSLINVEVCEWRTTFCYAQPTSWYAQPIFWYEIWKILNNYRCLGWLIKLHVSLASALQCNFPVTSFLYISCSVKTRDISWNAYVLSALSANHKNQMSPNQKDLDLWNLNFFFFFLLQAIWFLHMKLTNKI